ncbi:discoidin domain-containing protein [Flavivirga spongiicola]|uniref:Discoidin domain-containing protein n=1 Tax=Flavivirga spongiicola TaxID=421621 RepID=A0ABU7XVE9_9FLAO|nr:discoidin domain-containing protein [Flavivirga sp. MEBiC05379]MDO5979577.1 discoidin domain-containing protein [Flavivirga sp. MEBiC05379]
MKKYYNRELVNINKQLYFILFLLSALFLVQQEVLAQSAFRSDRLFIKHGIQYQAWTYTDTKFPGRPSKLNTNNINARYVRLQLPYNGSLNVAEIEVYDGTTNVAQGKTANQSSTNGAHIASRAVDGNTAGSLTDNSLAHTLDEVSAWWEVDLGSTVAIDSIRIWNRTDCCGDRLGDSHVFVSNTSFSANQTIDQLKADPNVTLFLLTTGGVDFPQGTEWTNLNLTAPTWYERGMFNQTFFNEFPNSQWSLEKAPYGDHLDRAPNTSEINNGFLRPDQLSKLSQLSTIGFGDEEHYSSTVVNNTKAWFDVSKAKYPDVLVHNNQYIGQWSDAQIRSFVQIAQPDFISYDWYYYNSTTDNGRSFQPILTHLDKYRGLAFEGSSPINYGFYLQGFKHGNYVLSETQINGHAYLPLLMGAKWLNIFRYVKDNNGTFYFHNSDGTTSDIYTFYGNLGGEIKNLSPHLSRLKSTKVTVAVGQHQSGGSTLNNAVPVGSVAWSFSSSDDPYVTGITATNLGSTNNSLSGDTYIGYFTPVTGIDNTSGVTMAPVHNKDAKYFMLMNGLSAANTNNTVSNTSGRASTTQQRITLSIDFGSNPIDQLKRVNKSTGNVETVALTSVSGTQYTVDITLDGGKGDLFYWQNAHTATPPVTPTNLALSKTTTSSGDSHGGVSGRAVDGNTDGNWTNNSVTHSDEDHSDGVEEWWEVDLGQVASITDIKVYNRTDCCADRLSNYHVFVSDVAFTSTTVSGSQGQSGVSDFNQTTQAGTPTTISVNRNGRYVRVQLSSSTGTLSLAEVEVLGTLINPPVNLALNKTATQSSTSGSYVASKSIDGNTSGIIWPDGEGSHTNQESQPWWQVDLGAVSNITDVKVYNRTDCCADRLTNYHIFVSDAPFTSTTIAGSQGQSGVGDFHETGQTATPSSRAVNRTGRYIRIQLENTNGILHMGEVQVFGTASSSKKTSLKSKELENDISEKELLIYPNPTKSKFSLRYLSQLGQIGSFKLFDIHGRVVIHKEMRLNKGSNLIEFSVKSLTKGIYILKGNIGTKQIVKKLLID